MIINSFKGIHNTNPARSIPDNALVDAVDVDIDNVGVISKRSGYRNSLLFPAYSSISLIDTVTLEMVKHDVLLESIVTSYTSKDRITYLVAYDYTLGNILCRVNNDLSLTCLCLTSATEFCDFSRNLFTIDGLSIFGESVTNLSRFPILDAPIVSLSYGGMTPGRYSIMYTYYDVINHIESGTSPIAVVDIGGEFNGYTVQVPDYSLSGFVAKIYETEANGEVFYERGSSNQVEPVLVNSNPFPINADKIEYFDSRLFVSERMGDYSVVWFSKKWNYHLWGADDGYFVVPGSVLALKANSQALIIGTDKEIYAYVNESLERLADYGVIEGRSIAHLADDSLLIYTVKGVCSAMPFTPITEYNVRPIPSGICSTSVLHENGIRKFIALHNNVLADPLTASHFYRLTALSGDFVISSGSANVSGGINVFNLIAGAGSFSISPQNATLTIENPIPDYTLTGGTGSFSIQEQSATLTLGEIIPDYTLTGGAGAFSISPQDATLTIA